MNKLIFFLLGVIIFAISFFFLFDIFTITSDSMSHDGFETPFGNLNWTVLASPCKEGACSQREWLLEHNITMNKFKKFSYPNGLNKGDVVLVLKTKSVAVGDVVVYYTNKSILHRVIAVKEDYISCKGDHNGDFIREGNFTEEKIPKNFIQGKSVLRIKKGKYDLN